MTWTRDGILALVGALLLSACTGVTPVPGEAPRPTPTAPGLREPPAPAPPAAALGRRAAVRALVVDAARKAQAGALEAAAASLERALRIQPDDPVLWQGLAKLRLQQNNYSQAEQLARRSLLAAGNRTAVAAQAWRIIAAARTGAGDAAGARAAQVRADALGSDAAQH
ncbi:MAG: tetratricopeptide repeat protein [Gammaproteobacteria bacterium]